MYPFKDRNPTKPNRKKITFEDDGSVKYATVEFADDPATEGTKLNRESLMTMQDLASNTVTFPDGLISRTVFDNGVTEEVSNQSDGTLKTVITTLDGDTTTLITDFSVEGQIREDVS